MAYSKRKTGYWTIALLLSLTLIASACGNSNEPASSPESAAPSAAEQTSPAASASANEPPSELVWYYPGPPQKDLAAVQEAVNKYTLEKINATVQLKAIDFGGYDQKMNTVLAANETFDLAFSTSAWLLQYGPNVRKGAFFAIDEILDRYPQLKEAVPQVMWDNLKIDGHIYAVPNVQTITNVEGFVVQKRFVDKYKLDPASIATYKDIEPFLEQIKQNEPGITPLGGITNFSNYHFGYWGVPEGLVKMGDPDHRIVPLSHVPEYKQHITLMHEWFEKGYVPKDIAVIATAGKWGEVIEKGNVAVMYANVLKPGGEVETAKRFGGNEVIYIPITPPYVTNDTNGAITAVSKTSKNPEKAVALLELINTDKYLYNLLCFGIEGTHYTQDGEYAIPIKDSGYDPVTDWVFGNQFNALFREGQDPNTWEITKEWNNTDNISPYIGVAYDTTPVKTEKANIDAVVKEYAEVINSGAVDPEKYINEFNEKLQKAGMDKVLAAAQNALNEFVANKGK